MTQAAADTPGLPLAGLHALLIEDEPIVALLVEDMLTELGCAAVTQAGSVAEATAALSGRRPDVAVLDMNLGGVAGYPVAEQLAAAKVPFIFATGYGQRGLAPDWPNPVLQKPFTIEALSSALTAALRRG